MCKLHILSADMPTPTADRFSTSFVLELDGECFMFDCGPAATHKLAKVGLPPIQVNHLFLRITTLTTMRIIPAFC